MKRVFSIVSMLVVLALLSVMIGPAIAQAAQVIPTISIVSVDPGKTVTIQTRNFPANDSFEVLMNKSGTLGKGGTRVDTVNSGAGGSLTFTFQIPAALQNEQIVAIRLQSPTSGYFSFNWFFNQSAGIPNTGNQPGTLPPGTIPTITIVSVDPGKTVTIQTRNYPSNDTFDVLMGKMGTQGVGGTNVGSVNSGAGGTLDFTFNVPAALAAETQIAIRLQSSRTGYFSYNWFNNAGSSGIPNTGNQPGTLPPGTIPTIAIVSVDPGKTVQISTSNFPANNSFTVLMGKIGTRGVGGIQVDTVNSSTGGTQTYTFTIPAALAADQQIAIRLQAPATGYFSYNWFNNVAATPGIPSTGNPPDTIPPGTVPTITISSVVRDASVTVQTANFPANDSFDVYMNRMGTQGLNGVKVDTISTGTGGAQTFTFTIPASLQGQQQIAIRLQSPTTGYSSYNWFWNSTAP